MQIETVVECKVLNVLVKALEWKCPACGNQHKNYDKELVGRVLVGESAELSCLQIVADGNPCGWEYEIKLGEEVYNG